MPKGRIENLRPFTKEQDREAARINGRKGGLAWGRIRRERREREEKEIAERLLRPWETTFKESTFYKLRLRQQYFISEYVLCGNATQAARKAGYSKRWAKNIGYRLLRRADIQAGLEALLAYIRHEC